MNYIMVDIEADGPVPGLYSMVSLGAVIVEPELNRTFRAELAPISDQWREDNLAVCGLTREQTLDFPPPAEAMQAFANWIETETKPGRRMITDNPTFDGGFINYYFERFLGPEKNPFGYNNARHLGVHLAGLSQRLFRELPASRKDATQSRPA